MSSGLESALRGGAAQLGLQLTDVELGQLLDYLALVGKWNGVYNLTAVRDPSDMLRLHLLDCLALINPLRRHAAGRPIAVLDVGSGAGLPGVVIAICCSDMKVDCVDTVGKKAAFIQQVAATLKLANLRGLHSRVEQLSGPYQVIASRAFASLADFVTLSSLALDEDGVWLAMKAKLAPDELAGLPPDVRMFHVEQLQVPGLNADRCLVWLERAAA